jgi:hypothetical protein
VFAITPDDVRQARSVEAAHLDAVLNIHGAKAIRLTTLFEALRKLHPVDSEGFELKLGAGDEPHIWLDLSHRITMEPDARTYRLSAFSSDQLDVLLETEHQDEVLKETQRLLAHVRVRRAWTGRESYLGLDAWRTTTLVYVWATGFVAGAAGLALLSIYMKKLPF